MATAKKAKKPRPRRKDQPKVRQPFLSDDMAPPRIPALDQAAETYYDAMMDRVKLSKEEDEAKDNLIDKMQQHGTASYTTAEGLVVTVTEKSNVRVKKRHEENGEADE